MSTKNLRISFSAWQELRFVKYKINANDYTDVLNRVLGEYKKESLSDDVRGKAPSDSGDNGNIQVPKTDKTIVISLEIHNKLHDLKNAYVIDKGYATRGPNAVSISNILMDVLDKYKRKYQLK